MELVVGCAVLAISPGELAAKTTKEVSYTTPKTMPSCEELSR
jgi:hypothetical protein